MLRGFAEDLKHEFRGYNSAALMKDLMAGLTVTAVALPLALAFGVSSGADAASGLITAIIAGLVMSLLAGGYYQISGPTGAMAAILTSLVAGYGLDGVFIATLLAGILLLLAGILRLGKLTSFIPAPVITGFTSGIAIVIALGQIDNFFGTHSEGKLRHTGLPSQSDFRRHRSVCSAVHGILPEKMERCGSCISGEHHPYYCIFHLHGLGCACGRHHSSDPFPGKTSGLFRTGSVHHHKPHHACLQYCHFGYD